jgi:hypothetical protein
VLQLKHSASFDSSSQEWQTVAHGLQQSPVAGMSKVDSCESFASYASTDLSSSLGCDLDYDLGNETENYLSALESELHNLKQSCFDMDSNIVHLQVAKLSKAKAKAAAPLLTAAEYHALAAELGLESDEDEQVAPYVASPVVGDDSARLAGERFLHT